MKNTIYAFSLMFIMLGACHPTYVVQNQPAPPPVQDAPPEEEVSYQSFYDELSPYGHWIDYPGYGYVWMPDAGPDFKPYATNGYWIYSDAGWTWASNYSWGWAPFHYGRWFYEGGYGWMWVPGNEWAPAWVSWRSNADYYGWAPLGPNVSVNVSAGSYNPPSNYWCFVPHQYVSNQHINNYYVNETRNVTIINNTTIINNRITNVANNNVTNNRVNNTRVSNRNVYIGGPDPREVERTTGTAVRPVAIRENNRPGAQLNNGQYNIYRPQVNAASQQTTGNQPRRVAPTRVETLRELRPLATSANNNNNQPANRAVEAPVNNNNNRANTNLPATRSQSEAINNNQQPDNNRFNNNNSRINTADANTPVNRNANNQPAAPVAAPANNTIPNNNAQDRRFNNRVNPAPNNAPNNAKPANTAPPPANNRQANNSNNLRAVRSSDITPANNVRVNNNQASQGVPAQATNGRNVNQQTPQRKLNAAPNTPAPAHKELRPVEKKQE